MSENEINVNFSLNENNLNPSFELSETENFDALFQIDSNLSVVGEGVINTVTENGTVTITSTTYIHEQGVASDVWVIEHNLNKYPSITLVDSANTQFEAQIEYDDKNTCTVYMNGATTGKAYLN